MTATLPADSDVIVRRNLTFHFERAIDVSTNTPEAIEVCVIPLSSPSSSPSPDATLVGGLQKQTVLLSQADNPVTFELVPTDYPGLTQRVTYRAQWRQGGIIGRTESTDFAMPDQDVNFNDLSDLGAVISGETYLQGTDLGVPGRVAALNAAGQVVDAEGNPVAVPADVQAVQANLNIETVQRQQADAALNTALNSQVTNQAQNTLAAAQSYTNAQLAPLNSAISGEAGARKNGDLQLQTQIDSLTTITQTNATTLQTKADLGSDGYVPISEINPACITNWIPCANQAAMLALQYPSQVQKGDVALTPQGVFGLLTTDPSNINNWYLLNQVLTVNGRTGNVVVTAADVGALTSTSSIPMTQVTGLSTALNGKAPIDVQNQVNTILGDTTYVHSVNGLIPNPLMPTNIALITPAGEVTTKTGHVVTSGSGAVESVNGYTGHVQLGAADVGAMAAGASLNISQVTGLQTALNGKVDNTDSRLSNARTPTAHAGTHQSGGTDPLTISQGQVTGLSTTLTSYGNRLGSLETRVTTLETSGTGGTGGTGAGTSGTAISWSAPAYTNDFSTVTLHSPFGIDSTSTPYLDPAGAVTSEVQWPYVTPNGHLQLRQWNESNPPDPAMATQAALDTTNAQVALKANQTDLNTTNATVATKANQSDLTSLTSTVASKADQATVNALSANKANQTDLNTTNATVSTKANQSDMTTAQNNITTLQTQMTHKADLDGTNHVPVNEIPSLPVSQITGLSTQLGNKADLVSGLVPLNELPQNIPQNYIANLPATLSNKADLVNGTIPTSQMPAVALTHTYVVSNRTQMLALTAVPGDVAVINQPGPDQGSYILQGTDPTQFSSWVELATPGGTGAVNSVNGYTGTVVLSWSDVGAMAANASVPISQVSGLQGQLNTFATTTQLATKTSSTDVQNMLTASVEIKQRADYVATAAVASLNGQQSADGVIMPVGSVVLLTAQASSITNGLWVVNSSAWTRPNDFQTGAYLVRGTLVLVNNQTTAANGTANNFTFWQETSPSGVVDTAASNWFRVMTAGPPLNYTQGNGIAIASQKISAVAASGGGCQVTANGIGVDSTVARKTVVAVPPGNTVTTITHNLNTTSVSATLIDVASGDMRLICPTIQTPNTFSYEFASAPQSNQYRCLVIG